MDTELLPDSWRRTLMVGSFVVIAIFGAVAWMTFANKAAQSFGADLSDVPFGADFRGFQAAGELASARSGESLYDAGDPAFVDGGAALPLNPPWFSIVMIPVAALGFAVGYALWTTAGFAALGAMLIRLRTPRLRTVLVIFLLTLSGFFNVWYGQPAFFFAALVGAGILMLDRGRGLAGAALLACAAFKPHLLLGFVVWWLWDARQRWPWILAGTAVTGSLVAVSWWWLPGAWQAWFERLPDTSDLVLPATEVTIWAAARLALGASWGAVAITAAASIGVVWLLVMGLRRVPDVVSQASLAIVASLLLSLHGMWYDWTVLLVAGALLLHAHRVSARDLALGGMLLGAILYGADQATAWQLDAFGRALHLAPLALLAVFAWLVRHVHTYEEASPRTLRVG